VPETPETRKKRLLHRSRYRGMLEADLLFGRFAAACLEGLGPDQLDRYEALLEEGDNDLLAWVAGRRAAPARHENDVMAMLRRFEINAR
jgi:succinate dehydrogenase flavin-adding protein (antitoxin of CptAB toxin-antitoxin module)